MLALWTNYDATSGLHSKGNEGAVKASVLSISLDRLISIDLKLENRMRSQNNLKRSVRV